jgi:hypothetical protein
LAGVGLVVAQSVAHLIVTVEFHRLDTLVDLDHSNGIPDVVSNVIIVSAALGAVVLAARDRRGRLAALALADVLLLVGLDDALHTGDTIKDGYSTVVIGTLVATLFLTVRVAMRSPRLGRICLLAGIALLVLDAKAPYFYDQFMNTIGRPYDPRGTFLIEFGIVLDEAMELMAWVLIAVGLWDAARAAPSMKPARPELARAPAGTGIGRA